jgi:hypothetical protein
VSERQHLSQLATAAADHANRKAGGIVLAVAFLSVTSSVVLSWTTMYGHWWAISLLAVILVAWRWGSWTGLLAAAAITALSTTLMFLVRSDPRVIARDNLGYLAMAGFIAVCVGVAGNLLRRLRLANEEIKRLQGLLPICASCKKIRDEEGSWHQLEAFIVNHSEARFTHGYCPECAHRLFDVPLESSAESKET